MSQATGTANLEKSTLAPAAVNGASAQPAQQPQQQTAPAGIAGSGQSTILQADPGEAAPQQTTASFSRNQPTMPEDEFMMVMTSLFSEQTMPWLSAESQMKIYGFKLSEKQMELFKNIRDHQASLTAQVMERNNGATKPEEKNTEGKK